jgi:hypothetical protein
MQTKARRNIARQWEKGVNDTGVMKYGLPPKSFFKFFLWY